MTGLLKESTCAECSSATGASRRELSKQFSQQGVPATIAASLHEASAQLQQDRHLPREGKLTGRGMVAGASAAGLGRLHVGSLPVQRSSNSAQPSMKGNLSMDLQQGGHSGKRQKTSDSEDEVGSFPASEASSAWQVQASAVGDLVPAGVGKCEQDSSERSPGYREGVRETANTHRGSDSKQKGPGIPASALDVKDNSAARHTPPTSLLPSNGIEQKNMHIKKEAEEMPSLAKRTLPSSSDGPSATMMSPQRMPQRYDPALSGLLLQMQQCIQLRLHSTAALSHCVLALDA